MKKTSQRPEFNIYCDESCHLPNDGTDIMVLGAVWCPINKRVEIFDRIKEIKLKHGLKSDFEAKWHKVSPAKAAFYLDIIDYFFDDDDIHFRGLIVRSKTQLKHELYNQDHDTFYYKMHFDMLKVILDPECAYNIYIDRKDSRSKLRVKKLEDVLRSSQYDFSKQIVKKVQQVNSVEVAGIQVADLLAGGLSYLHRELGSNEAKLAIVKKIIDRSGYSLRRSTLYMERKFNLFIWTPREMR